VTKGARVLYHGVTDQKDLMQPLTRRLEALLFVSPHPVPEVELATAAGCTEGELAAALAELAAEYTAGRHGIEVAAVAGGHTFRVASDCEDAVRSFAGARPPEDLSPALIETLSIVAYLQPTTRAEVAQIRGVSSEWALAALGERGLVEECGRATTPGAPILYGTTGRFLRLFGLRDIGELPPLEEYALGGADVEELRARLLANAERRSP
jgi:segregation and condensation protein B